MFEVVDKFCRGHPPVDTIFPTVNKLTRSGHGNIALEFVRFMDGRFGYVSKSVFNTLLDGFGRENKLNEMENILSDENYVQNDFSYIIAKYHRCKSSQNVSEVLQVFQDMMNYEFDNSEDMFIYNNIIQDLCHVGR
ncbi:hypothetical protein FRX31_018348 [Thalictrum thalictroides]|uniref:Pentatricopeptide repeat-containing protein n=1 Tax=Thalictrum thalictroides TaxID=46969 RepID=A0A7J6W6V1_THATH|nr:hypothetical protein FRX31_018348 [Thalictrum thalictroides]